MSKMPDIDANDPRVNCRQCTPPIVHLDPDSLRRLYVNDGLSPRNRSVRNSDAQPGPYYGGCADLVSPHGDADQFLAVL
jgi:hypothetical protein